MTEQNGLERSSATERISAMLDERGVEWKADTSVFNGVVWTIWKSPWFGETWAKEVDGSISLFNCSMTPEQAIEATLGRGECEQEEHGWSTEGDHARVWLTCGHDCMVETVADLPNYCPNCGRKVRK